MRGPEEKLTRKQEVAIAALLTAPTIVDAADAAILVGKHQAQGYILARTI